MIEDDHKAALVPLPVCNVFVCNGSAEVSNPSNRLCVCIHVPLQMCVLKEGDQGNTREGVREGKEGGRIGMRLIKSPT